MTQVLYTIMLMEVGQLSINVIKVVWELVPGRSLREAKELVDTAPQPIKEYVSFAEASAVQARLRKLGATTAILVQTGTAAGVIMEDALPADEVVLDAESGDEWEQDLCADEPEPRSLRAPALHDRALTLADVIDLLNRWQDRLVLLEVHVVEEGWVASIHDNAHSREVTVASLCDLMEYDPWLLLGGEPGAPAVDGGPVSPLGMTWFQVGEFWKDVAARGAADRIVALRRDGALYCCELARDDGLPALTVRGRGRLDL